MTSDRDLFYRRLDFIAHSQKVPPRRRGRQALNPQRNWIQAKREGSSRARARIGETMSASWGASFLRPAKGRKPPLKEKFVAIYESFFDEKKLGEKRPRRFWDELFLLHVNAPFLISLVRGVSEERLFAIRSSVSEICSECVGYLHDANLLRVSHALETLIIILQYVSRKRFAERGLGVIDVAAGGCTIFMTTLH